MGVPTPKHIHVTCAIIEKDGLVLAAKRGPSMSMPGTWEFPGGKIMDGETLEACIKREIMEELGVDVTLTAALSPSTHAYPGLTVTLYPFRCTMDSSTIILLEHAEIRWMRPSDLPTLNWADADVPVVRNFLNLFSERPCRSGSPWGILK